MTRSGYTEDFDDDQWRGIMWRGAVASAIRGHRGQAFLRELVAPLDTMPDKRLIAHDLIQRPAASIYQFAQDGPVCALGAVGAARGMDLEALDPEDYIAVAHVFGIAAPMAQEIMWWNDERAADPAKRWADMRAWAVRHIREPKP